MRISRSRSGGSLTREYDCLIDILIKRNAVMEKLRVSLQNDPNLSRDREVQLFQELPKQSARQISRLVEFYENSDGAPSRNNTFDFHVKVDVLRELAERNRRSSSRSDWFCFIVFFHGIAAGLLHTEELEAETFQLLLELLTKVVESEYRAIGQFLFKIIWRKALFESKIVFDISCFTSVITYLTVDRELGGDCYPWFIEFMARAFHSGNRPVIDSAFSLLVDMFDDRRVLVRDRTHEKLIQLMEPFIQGFNHRALTVLAKISNESESSAIEGTYFVLPSCFLDFIQKSDGEIIIEQSECEVLEDIEREVSFDFEISDFGDFSDGLLPLPSVILDDFVLTTPFLSQEVQKVVSVLKRILSISNVRCVESFFTMYLQLMSTLPPNGKFYDVFVAFLSIYGKQKPPEVFHRTYPRLLSSPVLSPKHSIFYEGTLSPIVNSLRNSIIEMIISNDDQRLPELVYYTAKYPVLCAEMIVRVCAKENVPVSLLADSKTLGCIVQLATYFQGRTDSLPMRSAVFVMMFKLCVDEQTSLVCFSVREFMHCYFRFLFEKNLCDMILWVFEKACCQLSVSGRQSIIEPTIRYLAKIIDICSNKGYTELVVKLGASIAKITTLTPKMVTWFAPLIIPMLKSLQKLKSHALLIDVLSLIFGVSQADPEFSVTLELSHLILASIKEATVCDKIFRILLSCLAGSRHATPNGGFLIQRPAFLPLIVTASPDKYALMVLFSQLASYSLWNAGALHDGDVDMILLDYLATGQNTATVFYAGEPIDFSFTDGQIRTLIHPLLLRICSYRSSYAVAHRFLELALLGAPMAQLLHSAFVMVNAQPRPLFPVGSYDYVCSIAGLTPSDLSSQFSITAWMNVDGPALRAINGETTILSMNDSQQSGRFVIFISNCELYARFDYQNTRTSVKLLKHLPANQWFLLSIVVRNFQEGALLMTFIDKERRMDSEMCCIMLHQGPMEIRIGGYSDRRDSVCSPSQAILIGNLRIFNCQLTDDDIACLWADMDCRDEFLLVSTAGVTTGYRTVTERHGRITFSVQQRITYAKPITYYMKDSLLLDMLTAGIGCSHQHLLFGLLQLSFSYSIEIQKHYMSTDQLISTLTKPSFRIDTRVYQMVLSVYSTITDVELKYQWLASVLLNIWIWTKSDAKSLLQILSIWKASVLDSNAARLKKESLFSKLIGQFSVVFGSSKYIEKLEADNPECLLFMKEASDDEIRKLGDVFFDFITRVGLLRLDQNDVDALFSCCFSSGSSEIIIRYLKAIRTLSDAIFSFGTGVPTMFIEILHGYATSDDVNICLEAILTIHDLARDQLQQEVVFIARHLQNGETLKFIYDQLRTRIATFPNLYPLIFILAINLEDKLRYSASECVPKLMDMDINTESLWYVWPVFYAFSVDDASRAVVLDFVAATALKHGRQEVERIFSLINLLHGALEYKSPNIPSLFFNLLYGRMPTDSIDIMYSLFLEVCSIIFFHFTARSHNKTLVDTFNKSVFHSSEDFQALEFNVTKLRVRNTQEIAGFFDRDFEMLHVHYELQFPDRSSIVNDASCQIMFRIAGQLRDSKLEQVADFIRHGRHEKSEASFSSFHQTLEWIKGKHIELQGHAKSIISGVRALFHQSQQLSQLSPESQVTLSLIGQRVETNAFPKPFVDVNAAVGTVKRDSIMCRSIVPMKLKTKRRSFTKRRSPSEPFKYSASCVLLMFGNSKDVVFGITQSAIIISGFKKGDKFFPFKMIESIWPRDNGGTNTRIEILTTNGLLMLLDFVPISNTVVMSHIQSVNEQVCQRQMSTKTDAWEDGKLSNFEYIMRLNLCSGRGFNDPALYPLFPALVGDFDNCYKCRDFLQSADSIVPSPPVHRLRHLPFTTSSLKDDLTRPSFLPPEFFCFPNIVMESDDLPPWACNGFELVYTLRKVLESAHVSALLSSWIDCVWGRNSKGQLYHSRLFEEIHLPKKMRHPVKIPSLSSRIEFLSTITFGYCDGTRLVACTADGHIHFADVQIDTSEISIRGIRSTSLPCGVPFFADTSSVYVYSRGDRQVLLVNADLAVTSEPLRVGGDHIAISATAIAYCQTPSSIRIRLRDGSWECRLCNSKARITCLALSEDFHLVAYGTVSGTLHLVSTTTGHEQKVLSLNGETPEAVMITKHWGFVVARTRASIFVFTVSGEPLRRAALQNRVIQWATFASDAGFDYLVFQTESFDVFTCEVPYPDILTPVCRCPNVVSLAYSNALESFVMVTSSKKVKCFSFPISDALSTLPIKF